VLLALPAFLHSAVFLGFTQNKRGGVSRNATEDCDDDIPELRRKSARESSGDDDEPEDTEEPDPVDSSRQPRNKGKTLLSFQENNSHSNVCADR